jgi:hypothetical protein
MKGGDMAKMENLVLTAQEQDMKIERGLKFVAKLPKNKQLKELNAIELEAKDFQKIIIQLQRLKGGLKRRSPEHARLLNDIELLEDREVDVHLKFQKLRKQVLGLGDSAVGGGGGGNSKGVLMAAALGMKIGEQGVKKTEEILATLKEANNLMDSMQGDILEQRKKLFRIKDQVKNAQSLTNRGKEALKYFANQAAKDVCIIVLIILIAVMIVGMGVLTYQINQEKELVEASPEELAEQNMEEMGIEINEDGTLELADDAMEKEMEKNKGNIDGDSSESGKSSKSSSEEDTKEKETSEAKKDKDDDEKGGERKLGLEARDKLEQRLRQRFLNRNRKVLISLKIGGHG